MTVRPTTREDLAAIAQIQRASPEASAWEPASYLEYYCRVAISAGRVVGFLVFRRLTQGDAFQEHEMQEHEMQEHEILNLGVEPASRRKGVARMLLQRALAEAPGAWFLEVRESNLAAIRLYESLGFRPAGERKDYYQDPPEAAIVMRFLS
jgi:ribosomal protein S18 acetylase RimI-like enzyme